MLLVFWYSHKMFVSSLLCISSFCPVYTGPCPCLKKRDQNWPYCKVQSNQGVWPESVLCPHLFWSVLVWLALSASRCWIVIVNACVYKQPRHFHNCTCLTMKPCAHTLPVSHDFIEVVVLDILLTGVTSCCSWTLWNDNSCCFPHLLSGKRCKFFTSRVYTGQ